MHLKTILNRVYHHPGFVYSDFRFVGTIRPCLEVTVRPKGGTLPVCSICGEKHPGYDTLPKRGFDFIPFWGITVVLLYAMRRVDCPIDGVKVERVPWATGKAGKGHLTKAFAYVLAHWAKQMSWKQTAKAFFTSWENVFRSVEMVVIWGLAHRCLDDVRSIGVDEILWLRGKFLTVVYQIDAGRTRLLWLGVDRKAKTLLRFFREFGRQRAKALEFVCSDMWQPYLKVIAKKARQAVHILDRFHIMSNMNKAIDEVRRQEVKTLKTKGMGEVLKGARWTLLKRPENRTANQENKLAELVRYNLRAVRAHLLREEFQHFWDYVSPFWAGTFLDRWCIKVMRSRLDPMKKIAASLRSHRPLILNWFRAREQVSLGATEGLNNKAKVITRRAFGLRTYRAMEIALYHTLGDLPDPLDELAHRFC